MQIKQSQQELEKIMAEVSQSLKPAVFTWTNPNVQMISGHAAVHFATNGVIDLSFANLRKAIAALKDSLSWVVPPVASAGQKPVYGAEQRGLKNHAQPEEYKRDPSKDVIGLARTAALNGAAEELFGQCMSEIQNFQGRTHSATARGREILKGILDKALAGGKGNLNPAVAAKCLEDIQARCRTLWE